VLALPGRTMRWRISNTSPRQSIRDAPDPGQRHHRQQGRSIKPAMFANVKLYSPGGTQAVGGAEAAP